MKKKFAAEFISLFLNPLTFLTLIPFIVVFRQTKNLAYSLEWELFSLVVILIGLGILLYGMRSEIFSDFDLSKREERQRFYHITLVLALVFFVITVLIKGIFFHLSAVILACFLVILAFNVVNGFIKASIHLGTVCAFVFAMGLLFGLNVFIYLVFLIPLMAWSRLFLKKHTPKELLVGGLLGTVMTILSFIILEFLI
jgi:membrane-associated phospholipid phosphatase